VCGEPEPLQLIYAKQLGLWQPTTDEKRGTAIAPAAVFLGEIRLFIRRQRVSS
jgi:hypothetical protein